MSNEAVVGLERRNRLSSNYPKAAFLLEVEMPNFGFKHSKETKLKMKLAHQGKNGGMLGKHHTIETKRKLCKINLGKHLTDGTKKKLSIAFKGKYKGSKNTNWRGGIAEYPNHAFMKKQRLIILLNNPECEVCGRIATEIHHKDKSKRNHKLSNLMAVCHKCNMGFHLDKIGRPKKVKR